MTPNALLSDAEIAELTGVDQPAAQLRVLHEHGLRPVVRRDGRPRITWAALDAAITSSITPGAQDAQPDWSAIKRRA